MSYTGMAIIGREAGWSEALRQELSDRYPALEVVSQPMIQTREIDFELPALAPTKTPVYLFTSPRSVRHFLDRTTLPRTAITVALGRGTARALREFGIEPALIGSVETAEGLAPEVHHFLSQREGEHTIIQPTSHIAGNYLRDYLSERGIEYHTVTTYEVVLHPELEAFLAALRRPIAFIIFYSPSGVRAWSHATQLRPRAISIGPVTAEELRRNGWKELYESQGSSDQELLETVINSIQN
ncbi:MAG: uroporphyrinogen-III synthase [Porphyromonas sp.]|nr:uroporphyrinogen-III synthase [Porphyromonas sp.]